jgi:hypothetical protein
MMERWQQIESLFQQALERNPGERNAWLLEACQGDSDLRREVASLLANHQDPESASDEKGSVHITVLVNFFDELRRRLP